MVPSKSKGLRLGPVKSSVDMYADEKNITKQSSKYLTFNIGNHGDEMNVFGRRQKSLMLLNKCHKPNAKNAEPGKTCPTRDPMFWIFMSW